MTTSPEIKTISAQSGVAFRLSKGQRLKVIDPDGEQVADLFCFACDDLTDTLSSGRSIDYNDTTQLTTGHFLYAQSGRVMARILQDSCGRHDFLVTPCSEQMFQMMARDPLLKHPSCLENMSKGLRDYDCDVSRISTTFNIFMNVPVDSLGKIKVLTPLSRPNDFVVFEAEIDLFIGLTACSDPGSNGGKCKPIQYEID